MDTNKNEYMIHEISIFILHQLILESDPNYKDREFVTFLRSCEDKKIVLESYYYYLEFVKRKVKEIEKREGIQGLMVLKNTEDKMNDLIREILSNKDRYKKAGGF